MNQDLNNFANRLLVLFPKLHKEIAHYESHYLKSGTLTLPQLCLLEHLSSQDLCQMRSLADAMYLRFSSASGLVDRMAQHGLVSRKSSPQDRRIVHISITSKGRKIIDDIHRHRFQGIKNLFGKLSANERGQYLIILEKLVLKLSERSS